MTDLSQSWSEIGQIPALRQSGIATIADRGFCYSGRSGNLMGTGPLGFFYEDTRFLSAFRLRVNGQDPEVVDAGLIRADEAVFHLRSRVGNGEEQHEPGLLVSRHRYQGNTLHEDIMVENRSGEPTSLSIELTLGTDFAPLLDVRLAGARTERLVQAHSSDGEVRFSYESEAGEFATTVSSSQPCEVDGASLRFSVLLGEGKDWSTCVDVVPEQSGVVVPIGRTCTTEEHEHGLVASPVTVEPPRLKSSVDALEHLWVQSLLDLGALEFSLEDHRIFAAGIPWFVALFGRDSIITSLQTLLLGHDVALETAELLAQLQGREVNPAISEEPGKILHEVRLGEHSQVVAGGARYYGTVDATPLFCILLGELWDWGCDPDRLRELLPAMRAAVGWIEYRLEVGNGLLTYDGDATRLVNQSWKDSPNSMVDGSGREIAPPVAAVEVQGYAVAALRAAARLEAAIGVRSQQPGLSELADGIQQRIDDRFWLDDLGTFAMAVGGDGHVADTLSSNPGHLLWARAVQPDRAAAVARTLVGDELWSGWGVRTLSSRNPGFNPVSYHLGSVWPHDTMLCAAGLLNYGHIDEALTLFGGLLAAASHFSYQLPELFSGFDRDDVPYPVGYPTSSAPQAWAAATPIYLTQLLLGIRPEISDRNAVVVSPRLPEGVELRLDGVKVGSGRLSVRAEGTTAHLLEVPQDVDIVVR